MKLRNRTAALVIFLWFIPIAVILELVKLLTNNSEWALAVMPIGILSLIPILRYFEKKKKRKWLGRDK